MVQTENDACQVSQCSDITLLLSTGLYLSIVWITNISTSNAVRIPKVLA